MFWRRKKEKSTSTGGGVQYIICGLGNPGTKYENTRHNCGFMLIDDLAAKNNVPVKKLKFKSLTGEAVISDKKCLLMKPTTYMNKSGEAITEAMRFYKLEPSKVIVICDEIAFDVGVIRIRERGSDGGQKGLRNLIMLSGSDAFPRVRIGVGERPHKDMKLSDWVLSPFLKSEGEQLEFALSNAIEAVEMIVDEKLDVAMNKLNGVKPS